MASSSQVVRMQRNVSASREDQRKKVPCKFMQLSGRCTNPNCVFNHDLPNNPKPKPSGLQLPQMCHFHQKGFCTFGDKCRNYHDEEKFKKAITDFALPQAKAPLQSTLQDDEIVIDDSEQESKRPSAPVQTQQPAPGAGQTQSARVKSKAVSQKRSVVSSEEEKQAAPKRSSIWDRIGQAKQALPDTKPTVLERVSRHPPSATMQQADPILSSGPSRRPSAPGGPGMLLNKAMEAADRSIPATEPSVPAAQGFRSPPFQAPHMQQPANGQWQHQQQQFADPDARWQGFQHTYNAAPHMVSTRAALHARDGPVSEQRLTSRMSQMQMDPVSHQLAAPGSHAHMQAAQQQHAAGFQWQTQSLGDRGRGQGVGRGSIGLQAKAPAAMNLAAAPSRGGGNPSHVDSHRDGMAAGGVSNTVGKAATGQQSTLHKAGTKANFSKGQGQGAQRKRKSDDEGSSGDPPASRRRVASSGQAVAGANTSTGEAATPSSTDDWKAAAAEKLQRCKPARTAHSRAAGESVISPSPRTQAQSQTVPRQLNRPAATTAAPSPSNGRQSMAIDTSAAVPNKPARAASTAPSAAPPHLQATAPNLPSSSVQIQRPAPQNAAAVQHPPISAPAEATPIEDMDDTLRTLQRLLEQG